MIEMCAQEYSALTPHVVVGLYMNRLAYKHIHYTSVQTLIHSFDMVTYAVILIPVKMQSKKLYKCHFNKILSRN